jgi:RHS repeat-associated protein
LDNSGNVVERYLSLPGGTLLTKRSSSSTFSLVNVHGDVFATTDANGANQATFTYDPFGNPVASSPTNTATGATYDWAGRTQRSAETAFALRTTQMGARTYVPVLGRFLQTDPVEGGTLNSYVYALDPVNTYDLTGKWVKAFINLIWSKAKSLLTKPSTTNNIKNTGQLVPAAAANTNRAAVIVRQNNASGLAKQEQARVLLESKFGTSNVLPKTYLRTPLGGRYPDFIVKRAGQPDLLVEVKSGGARYGGSQLMKDAYLVNEFDYEFLLLTML